MIEFNSTFDEVLPGTTLRFKGGAIYLILLKGESGFLAIESSYRGSYPDCLKNPRTIQLQCFDSTLHDWNISPASEFDKTC